MKPSRREFLGGAVAVVSAGLCAPKVHAQAGQTATAGDLGNLVLANGRIHTMDRDNRVVSQLLIRNGRFAAVGNSVAQANAKVVDLRGRTVIPGLIDAHDHIVLVGNRPGWHTPLEHVFTIPDAIAALKTRSAMVPSGAFITTIGPISAMQFAEGRLPNLMELDAVGRPVYLQAAQGGTRTNTEGKAWLEKRGVTVAADGAIAGAATGVALLALRKELLTPDTRKRSAFDALQYYAQLGITTHRDSGAFHADELAPGLASENTYTMHEPFLALNREGRMPARLRIDFLHQDAPTGNPPLATSPTIEELVPNVRQRLAADWRDRRVHGRRAGRPAGDRTGGLAWRGPRAEPGRRHFPHREPRDRERGDPDREPALDHLAHPRLHCGTGEPRPCARDGRARRLGTAADRHERRSAVPDALRPRLNVGYHSDGGDITVINPWLNLYTMITGRNLAGEQILGDQTLTRQQTLRLATAANKWFIWEDDIGSIEVGNHADLAVLDRDYFTVPR